MSKNICETIRQELDELMLDETSSAAVLEHLRECAACREFHQKQTKLRQIVGSLGTVSAPPDFDFRLRARLASDSSNAAFHFQSGQWTFARRGFALAAVLLVFATGAFYLRSALDRPTVAPAVANNDGPKVQQPVTSNGVANKPWLPTEEATTPPKHSPAIKNDRPVQIAAVRPKRPLAAKDSSFEGATVIREEEPLGSSTAFPLDAALQSFRVSVDDGRGNARTISVPTISFGSQRVSQTGNQFAQKRDW